ncbi:HAD-IB family hydrolase [Streptomyces sp. NPDC000410]|uniref:HAD family hydrolase n=1 Tax=Streptomyces sp. NPDC000410 TaxID=3154254 RepID=UPI00332A7258
MRSAERGIAFFDVDDTLITFNSMLSFLAHHWAREGSDPSRFDRVRTGLLARRAEGVPRAELNRAYYRHYRGCDAAVLARHGREWYAAESAKGTMFHAPAVEAVRRHRGEGRPVALVSGSFRPCLDPIAEALDASLVLCTAPLTENGVLTGEVDEPVIGERKALLAVRVMDAHGARAADCYAYGDHSSDLALLRSVGHPVAVGDDAVLAEWAGREGWARLPAARGARPSAA